MGKTTYLVGIDHHLMSYVLPIPILPILPILIYPAYPDINFLGVVLF